MLGQPIVEEPDDAPPRQQNNQFQPRGRKGLANLRNIIYNDRVDFKRSKDAMSVTGANKIIGKHNSKAKNDAAKWHMHYEDMNGDDIPDLEIHNSEHQPIYINGWTTKTSDWPYAHEYYSRFPTKEARTNLRNQYAQELQIDPKRVNTYKVSKKQYYEANPANIEAHSGVGYKAYKEPTANPYTDFTKFVMAPFYKEIIPLLINARWVPVNRDGTWYDVGILGKVTGIAYKKFVLEPLAGPAGIESKTFKKWKKSTAGSDRIHDVIERLIGFIVGEDNQQFKAQFVQYVGMLIKELVLEKHGPPSQPQADDLHTVFVEDINEQA